MKRIKHLALLLLLLFGLEGQGTPSAARASATIEITTLTQAGESVDESIADLSRRGTQTVDLTSRWSNKSFRANFKGLYGSNIPYGDYTLKLTVPGFREYEQILRVYQPLVSVRVTLIVSRIIDMPIPTAKGSIKPIPRDAASLWVKLMPITNNNSLMDARVQADGTFQLAGFDHGAYLLAVIRGTDVIYSKQLLLHGGENNINVLLAN